MLTPYSFLGAISEGTDPTARDTSQIDRQIKGRQIKVYVYNSQNATPDVRRQVDGGQGGGHRGRHGDRDADPGRRHLPGLAGPPTQGARGGAGRGDREVTVNPLTRVRAAAATPSPPATARRAGARLRAGVARTSAQTFAPAPPVVSLRGAAVRVGGRTLWSGVDLDASASGRVRRRARAQRGRQVHPGQGAARAAAGSPRARCGCSARRRGPGRPPRRLPAAAPQLRPGAADARHRHRPARLGRRPLGRPLPVPRPAGRRAAARAGSPR